MKINDVRSMTTEELNAKLISSKTELFNLRFQHATGNLSNPMMLNTLKKDIAKIKTILTERQLNIHQDLTAKAAKKSTKTVAKTEKPADASPAKAATKAETKPVAKSEAKAKTEVKTTKTAAKPEAKKTTAKSATKPAATKSAGTAKAKGA